jgi:ferredoxin-NADP reductase
MVFYTCCVINSARKFRLRLQRKERQNAKTYSFYFSCELSFQFNAGQYVQMTLAHERTDSKGSSRFFTIASAPHESYLMITTRKSASSFKKCLFALKENEIVEGFGPIGTFVLD